MSTQVMRQENRLGTLHVGVARQVRITCVVGPTIEHINKGQHSPGSSGELSLGKQPQRSRHLVIATATCVQLAAGGTGDFGNTTLDCSMNVFVSRSKCKLGIREFRFHLAQRGHDCFTVNTRQHPALPQHLSVGNRPGNVVAPQTHIKANAGGVGH